MLERTAPDVLLACPIIEAHGDRGARGARGGLPRARGEAVRDRPRARRASSPSSPRRRGLTLGVVAELAHALEHAGAQARARRGPHRERSRTSSSATCATARSRTCRTTSSRRPIRSSGRWGSTTSTCSATCWARRSCASSASAARPAWSRYRVPSINQLWMETDERRRHLLRRNVLVAQRAHPAGVAPGRGRAGHAVQRLRLLRAAAVAVAARRRRAGRPDAPTSTPAEREYQAQYDLADLAVLQNFRAAVARRNPAHRLRPGQPGHARRTRRGALGAVR